MKKGIVTALAALGYNAWHLLPPMTDSTTSVFFIAVILFNAILYGSLAHLVSRRVSAYIDGS